MTILIVGLLLLLVPAVAYAHCPLCTIGAGAAALGASWLGVGVGPIGVFLGAFALAIGLWVDKLIPRKFVPRQDLWLGIISFGTTIVPIRNIIGETSSVYISITGTYGSLLNRTYYFDTFLVASIIGALLVLASPLLSQWVTKKRGTAIPYQGVSITFVLLVITAVIFELA